MSNSVQTKICESTQLNLAANKPSCKSSGFESIDYDALIEQIDRLVLPRIKTETIPLYAANKRVLAQDYIANHALPVHASSAMDGFALNSLSANKFASLKVVGACWAGDPLQTLAEGCAMPIATGALMPLGANAVVPIEQARFNTNKQLVIEDWPAGWNVKSVGSDLKPGQLLVKKGQMLHARALGLLASAGINAVTVIKPLKVLILSNGNELVPLGESCQQGQHYDVNAVTLSAWLQTEWGLDSDQACLPDKFIQLADFLKAQAQVYDVIITSGGASVGKRDWIRPALSDWTESYAWQINMKPAKPFSLARNQISAEHQAWLIALPGNPVAAMVSMALIGHRVIHNLMATNEPARRLEFQNQPAAFEWPVPQQKMQWLLVQETSDGIIPLVEQGASHLFSLCQADGWVQIPPHQTFQSGRRLRYLPFRALGLV
ncbi:molybdopterin molybdotransferase MoeA [Thiomicrospira cyclica]|uniref:Molybdopterin molybdenumtransferase n=1 Tax=Thiomicrospira cyclica (strain DSM 14477 / JCM 11371 / ALM1) TaxID=717773 RepID=F6DCH3_THICA|nr:molybdopterin molybdotransferase MoeA [Thiomicrospira cyclica]AEG31559.1 MoeA domain protein domain I and II [Thiomicrospira cyclica ALM1]